MSRDAAHAAPTAQTAPAAHTVHGARGREAVLTALLIATGAATLVHESVWFRLLVPVLGVGVVPAAAVSAGALLGLSAGAALGGRLADLSRRPVLVFVLAEAAAALLGLAAPLLVAVVARVDAALDGSQVLPSALAAVLLGIVALPMGASLPAAVRVIDPSRDRVAACFRRVYGWNTVGAVIGVALAAGWLLETLGNHGSILVASAAEAVAALAAVALLRRSTARGGAVPLPPTPGTASARTSPGDAFTVAAFLAGGAGLAVQVAWVRRLTPAVGTTYQAFATVLGVHLLALAVGSLLLGPRRGIGGRRGAAVVLVLAALPVALLPDHVKAASEWAALRVAEVGPDPWRLLLVRAGAAALLVLPSTLLGAAALPWLLRAGAPERGEAGRGTGRLLAANTAGSAVFALATALVGIPLIGTAATLRVAAGVYLAAALFVTSGLTRAAVALAAIALCLQPWVFPLSDDAGRDAVGSTFAPARYAPEDADALLYEEGPVSTIVVRDRDGRREFWIEGNIEASTHPTDRLHLALLGHLPMALHAATGHGPAHVGVIGLGSGMTSQGVAAWDPASLVVHEVEPAVQRAAALFAGEGGGLPPTARLAFGDGRRGVQRSAIAPDVVTSDPIHPGVAGSAWLYSLEHYRGIAARLPPGGLVCQWLPLYQLTSEDLRLVARTFAAAFKAPYLFLAGGDGILIGAREPLRVDEAVLRTRLAGPAGEGLRRLGLGTPGRLLGLIVRDPAGLRRFAGEGPLNTDDRLLLEFRAGRHVHVAQIGENARLLHVARVDPASLLRAPPSERFLAEVEEARALHAGLRAWLEGDYGRAEETFGERAAADPLDRLAAVLRDDARIERAFDFLWMDRLEDAADLARAVLAGGKAEVVQRLDAAEVLLHAGAGDEGRAAARAVLAEREWPRARRLAEARGSPR